MVKAHQIYSVKRETSEGEWLVKSSAHNLLPKDLFLKNAIEQFNHELVFVI